ncbi:armadillo-type protein [Xylaria arbuscula]|nr:armadillo-type protein [Xylaria arbuscula]
MSGSIKQLLDKVPENQAGQTKALRQVADIAANLWKTEPGSADFDYLAQKVGDAAREESTRIPLGESGILEFFCSVVSTQGLRSSLVTQCLRIIGNSSADQDENRARVVASGCLPSIVSFLNDDSILAFVIPVLFNIAVDYEPAQKAVYQAGINPELVSLISGPRVEHAAPLMSYIYKLLGFVAMQEPEANLAHPATPFILLTLAKNQASPIDAEDFLGQASVALTYLAQEQFQQSFIETPGSINLILQAFSTACEGLDISQEDPETEAQLKQVQTAFTATLADLSAHPLFASLSALDGPEVQILQTWISKAHIPLQSAACLTLGNIARSDEKCIHLVQQRGIHKPLIATLSDPSNTDAGLMHSILSFLKNLAIPAANKPVLGGAGLLETEALPRIWDLDAQTQVQFDAVSLTRLLLVGCAANVRHICAPDPNPEAAVSRTKLQLLISLNARSDQEPTQMETARALTTVCRVVHSPRNQSNQSIPKTPEDEPSTATDSSLAIPSLKTFYKAHSAITDAMLRLLAQTKFPALRSEILFVFALMARSEEGADAVARAVSRDEVGGVITEIITTESSEPPSSSAPSSQAQPVRTSSTSTPSFTPASTSSSSPSSSLDIAQLTAGLDLEAQAPTTTNTTGAQNKTRLVDRENALVLVAELLRRSPDALSESSKTTFETLLREGGERVVHERGGKGEKLV